MENNMTEDKTYFSENVSEEKKNTYFNEVVEKLLNNKLAMAGLIFFLLLSLLVIILPFILNLDPYTSDPAAFNSAPTRSHRQGFVCKINIRGPYIIDGRSYINLHIP